MRKTLILTLIGGAILPLILASCGTIIHGTKQGIGISSRPTGASVTVDNVDRGTTPQVVELSRKDHHTVRIELGGYEPYETTLTRSVSGWVWGNIVFGGLVGLAVDAISGGLYKLTPEQLGGSLAARQSLLETEDGLAILVTLMPDPSWERVGNLEQGSNDAQR